MRILGTYVKTPGSDSVKCQPLESSSLDIVSFGQKISDVSARGNVWQRLAYQTYAMNAQSSAPTPTPNSDPKVANRARFELELEFVQCLANPFYLHSLAQQNILDQPAFINFLEYLLYWKDKDYARFIQLAFLTSSLDVYDD
jgi:SOH1